MSDQSRKGDNEQVKPILAGAAEELSDEDLEQVAGGAGKMPSPSLKNASNEITTEKVASILNAAHGLIKP